MVQQISELGEPGTDKFELVLTGRHMTLRADGNTGEHVAFDGTVFHDWRSGARLPEPPAIPVPIYIGGQGPRVTRLMGELGDGALPLIFPPAYLPQVMSLNRYGLRGKTIVRTRNIMNTPVTIEDRPAAMIAPW